MMLMITKEAAEFDDIGEEVSVCVCVCILCVCVHGRK